VFNTRALTVWGGLKLFILIVLSSNLHAT